MPKGIGYGKKGTKATSKSTSTGKDFKNQKDALDELGVGRGVRSMSKKKK